MARRLPWKRSPDSPTPKSESPKPKSTPKSVAKTPTPASSRREVPITSSPSVIRTKRIRSPSTSPPPEPPTEQYMNASDDRYRMVEDELLHTARRFTAHLHRAEYDRLKRQARTQNANTVSEMERPVIHAPPMHTAKQRRLEAADRARQNRMAMWY